MASRTLIGIPTPGSGYQARWLHWGDHPDRLLVVLRHTCTSTFADDAVAMTATLLAHDWSELQPHPQARAQADGNAIAGVGVALDEPAGQPRTGAITDPVNPDLEWMYLIDPLTGHITVYEATVHGTWLQHSQHHLNPGAPAGSRPPTTSPPDTGDTAAPPDEAATSRAQLYRALVTLCQNHGFTNSGTYDALHTAIDSIETSPQHDDEPPTR